MKLPHNALYMRLCADAQRLGHPGIQSQVDALHSASRSQISRAQFTLSQILAEPQNYELEKVRLCQQNLQNSQTCQKTM